MDTRILTAADAAWDAYLERLPGADIYHTAAYHRAHEANGDGTARAFVAEEGGDLLLHPLMLRSIPGTDWKDAESVYGYSGPLCAAVGPEAGFRKAAWGAFESWCREHGLVAEFVRFNPLNDTSAMSRNVLIQRDRYTVVLDLSGSEADLWQRYSKTHRNMVRKALRVGLKAGLAMGWGYAIFQDLYRRTMEHNRASAYYLFGEPYFARLQSGLGDNLRLFVVRDGARVVASAIFMLYGDRMHYHLAGSDPDYAGNGDNNLLLHTAALWGQGNGYRWLHLGGGRTNAADDSLLRFKASVSRERLPFFTGRRVHIPAAYDALCAEWRSRHPGVDPGDYFLLWRKP